MYSRRLNPITPHCASIINTQEIDMSNAMNVTPVITLAYDTNTAQDWADLVE